MQKNQEHIVIITYDMIPHASSWGGCQRMFYLAEYLTKHGYEVMVFSCKKASDNNYGNEISFKTKSIELKHKLFKSFLGSKKVQKQETSEAATFQKNGLLASIRGMIKNNKFLFDSMVSFDSYIYNEPTFWAGPITLSWGKENIGEIAEYIENNQVHNVIISVPAFHMLAIGERLKRKFKDQINLVYDYRDPWNMWKKRSKFCFNREKKLLQYADKVVCTNQYLAEDMAKVFGIDSKKFEIVANGYSDNMWSQVPEVKKNEEKFVISYIGSIEIMYSGFRNIEKLIMAFRKFTKEHDDIELQFIGVNDVSLHTVEELKKEFSNISFQGMVPAAESLVYMMQADVLLVLHTTEDNSSKYIVSGKLYDYVRAGKPMLSIGSENGIHKRLIEEHKLGIAVTDDADKIYEALNTMYVAWKNKQSLFDCDVDVSVFSREAQYRVYSDKILKFGGQHD